MIAQGIAPDPLRSAPTNSPAARPDRRKRRRSVGSVTHAIAFDLNERTLLRGPPRVSTSNCASGAMLIPTPKHDIQAAEWAELARSSFGGSLSAWNAGNPVIVGTCSMKVCVRGRQHAALRDMADQGRTMRQERPRAQARPAIVMARGCGVVNFGSECRILDGRPFRSMAEIRTRPRASPIGTRFQLGASENQRKTNVEVKSER
jgi:hypothetical protein